MTPGLKLARALSAVLTLCGCAAVALAADPAPRYYALGDFQRVEKIDAHVHLHGTAERFMAQALQDNFRILTINVDDADFPPISEQQQAAQSLQKRYPGRVAFAATFAVEGFQSARLGGGHP